MPPTSPATERGRAFAQAFTLVELTVVCAILIVISAAVVPNLLAITQSRRLKDREADVARLPAEARGKALQTNTPVRLRVSGTTLVMEQVPATGDPQQIKTVDLGDSLQVETAQLNGKPSDVGSWTWTVSPDGSADSGGLQFSEGKTQKSLILSSTGTAQWTSGEMPDQSQDTWPAGQLLTRTGS